MEQNRTAKGSIFGVVEVNFDTQERKIRKSGQFYGELCKNNAVTEQMIKEYLK